MFHAVKTITAAHEPAWAGFIPFANAFDEFKVRLDAIEAGIVAQDTDVRGVTLDKGAARQALIANAARLATALRTMATITEDSLLLIRAKATQRELRNSSSLALIGKVLALLDAAADVSSEQLDTYGMSAAAMAALTEAFQLFSARSELPKETIMRKKEATEALKALIAAQMRLLYRRLDPAAFLLSEDAPDFYTQYKIGRRLQG